MQKIHRINQLRWTRSVLVQIFPQRPTFPSNIPGVGVSHQGASLRRIAYYRNIAVPGPGPSSNDGQRFYGLPVTTPV